MVNTHGLRGNEQKAQKSEPLEENVQNCPFSLHSNYDAEELRTMKIGPLVWILVGALCSTAAEAEPTGAATNRFYPVSLELFYQRLLASYRTNETFGAVPRGVTEFDGVPFRMFGKIEINGMGPTRANNFFPTRVGEIPVKRRVARLHLISGAGYKDPDRTPLAEVRLHYTNGEMRNIFISYGEHVRNWHVESDERRTDLIDPRSRIIWDGINGATGRPLRLFKNTFDNPWPGEEVRGIELLSLFGRAFPLFLALTLEEAAPGERLVRTTLEDPDDTPYRREMLVRVLDNQSGKSITNATLEVTVTEEGQTLGFGRYRCDQHGQVLLDYPPGKFEAMNFRISGTGFAPVRFPQASGDGIYPADVTVRLR
jgi:hypothetical protein